MKYKHELGMLVVTFLWGASFAIGKLIMAEITPNYYTFLRFSGAFLVLLVFFRKKFLHTDKQALQAGAIIGVAIATGYILQTIGLNYTTASKAGFLTGLYVVLVPVFEAVLKKKIPTSSVICGVGLATGGLAVLSLERNFSISFGDLMVFGGAVSFAISMILISKYAKQHDPMVLTTVQIGMTAVFSLGLAVLTEPVITLETFHASLIGLIIFVVLFGTAVNTAVQNWAQKYLSATVAALIFVLEPVFSGLFGFLLLGDSLGFKQFLGSGMIVVGMLVTLLSSNDVTG